jgi:hypothetical protein
MPGFRTLKITLFSITITLSVGQVLDKDWQIRATDIAANMTAATHEALGRLRLPDESDTKLTKNMKEAKDHCGV